jgi:hypothetical protein
MIPLVDPRQNLPGSRVRETVEEVLSAPAYGEDGQNPIMLALTELFDWIVELLEEFGLDAPAGTLEAGVKFLWFVIFLVVVLFLARLLILHLRVRAEQASTDRASAADELANRVANLRNEAREAHSAGDYTLALRLYFFALVIGLGQRGELEYNGAWTNRELLERGEPQPEIAQLLGPLVAELDAHSFGHVPTGAPQVRRFADLCERLLGGQPA